MPLSHNALQLPMFSFSSFFFMTVFLDGLVQLFVCFSLFVDLGMCDQNRTY